MDKNVNKVSNLYGRARRIAFVEKVVYWLVGIIAIVLIVFVILNRQEKVDGNVNFAYLRTYLEEKGYRCDMLHRVGGQCIKSGKYETDDLSFSYTHTFIRYEDGFEYINNSRGYILDIRHKSNNESRISFRTTDNAFTGYKNQTYSCTYKDNVINELGECSSSNGNVLDVASYISVIEQSIEELNRMIDSSGYKKDKLLNDFVWEKDSK